MSNSLKKKKTSIKALFPGHNLRTSNMINLHYHTHKNHKQVIDVVYFIVAGWI